MNLLCRCVSPPRIAFHGVASRLAHCNRWKNLPLEAFNKMESETSMTLISALIRSNVQISLELWEYEIGYKLTQRRVTNCSIHHNWINALISQRHRFVKAERLNRDHIFFSINHFRWGSIFRNFEVFVLSYSLLRGLQMLKRRYQVVSVCLAVKLSHLRSACQDEVLTCSDHQGARDCLVSGHFRLQKMQKSLSKGSRTPEPFGY